MIHWVDLTQGDAVPGSAGSVSIGSRGTGGASICDTPVVDITGTSGIFLLSFTVLKKSQAVAKASSLLVSLVIVFLPDELSWSDLIFITYGLVSRTSVAWGAAFDIGPLVSSRVSSLMSLSSIPPLIAGKSLGDSSVVTSKVVSVLISSYTGAVGVKCQSMVEYIFGVFSLGSPLLHSFCFKAGASSRTAKLGVIPVNGTHVDGTLVHP